MPHINIQFKETITDSDGNEQDVPGGRGLQARGPLVQTTISVSQAIADALQDAGKKVPDPQSGLALIDTGAATTCIDLGAARRMSLPQIDTVQMASASHSNHPSPVYSVSLGIQNQITVNAGRVIGAELDPQGLIALIGRDVLAYCTFFYNGHSGAVTLSV